MNGEDTILKHMPVRNNIDEMIRMRMGSLVNLRMLAGYNVEFLKAAEISADRLMRSDESDLKDEIRKELVKAKKLLRKKYPVRYFLSWLK